MAVALGNTNTSQIATFTGSVNDTTHFAINAGTNLCAFVVIAYDGAAGESITAVSINGNTCTQAGTPAHNATSNAYSEVWYLKAPPTGAAGTITVAITGAGSFTDLYYNLVVFSGVNQTTPVRAGTYTSTTGNAGTGSLTVSSNTNDLTLTDTNSGGASISGTNQTSDGINTGGGDAQASDHATSAASSVTHTWTYGATTQFALVGLSINGDPNNAGGGWVGGGSQRAPAQRGPFDRRGFLLSPYTRYSFAPSVVLNAYSFSADPGTYAVSGQTAGLLHAAALPALAGSYTLTGAAAKLLVGHAVNAGTATYAINGVATKDLRALLLNASSGLYTLSGFAATLQAPSPDHPLAVDPTTYALTGANATALRGVRTTVTGAYAISGAPALFLIQRGVPDAPTSYNVNGLAATLIYSGSGPALRVPWQRMGMRMGL